MWVLTKLKVGWTFKKIIWFFTGWFSRKIKLTHEVLPVVVLNIKSSNNTRYIDENILVIEVPPCKRTIFLHDGTPCRLFFPYIYFIIKYQKSFPSKDRICYLFESLKICFSEKQICSTKAKAGKILISNYYDPSNLNPFNYCLGEGTPRGGRDTLKEIGDLVVSGFWQTCFQMNRPSQWEYYSKCDDHRYIADMIMHKIPIKDIMEVGSNVEFKEYKFEESTGGISVNGHKKRIRRKHKKQGSRGKT